MTIKFIALVCLICATSFSFTIKKDNLKALTFPLEDGTITKGTGQFTYNNYLPLADKPVEVFYYSPKSDMTDLKILIVMCGIKRNADEYRDYWIELSNKYNLLIIAPEFSNEFFPKSRSYNLGNIFDENDQANAEDEWSFSLIEPLFQNVKNLVQNKYSEYYLFGHSAGAQFVHRFISFKPYNHVKKAIAANAGWYTTLDSETSFPYGIGHSPIREIQPVVFSKQLIILLGEDDCKDDSPNLRHTPEAEAQGSNRLSRGFFFFDQSKSIAQSLGYSFHWKIKTIPNIEHDGAAMSKAAAKLLFD